METRTVLLTGTSSGLGEAAARQFLAQGWKVVATARTAETAVRAEAGTSRLLRVRLDVTDARSIHTAFDVAETRFGAVDVVVNNAGVGLGGVLEAITPEQLRDHFEVNVIGTAAVCQAAIRRMRARREGLIINVTSLAGRVGLPFLTPYCAGKFAVEGLTESLFYELKLFGVRVKLVEPGGIRSNFLHPWTSIEPYEPIASDLNEMMKRGGLLRPIFTAVAHYHGLLGHSSTAWFEARFCTPASRGLPSSPLQHRESDPSASRSRRTITNILWCRPLGDAVFADRRPEARSEGAKGIVIVSRSHGERRMN